MSEESIKLAVQKNGCALKHVPKDKMTRAARMAEEFIILAVQNDGYSLLYLPGERMTKQMIEIPVQNYSLAIAFVPKEKFIELDIYN